MPETISNDSALWYNVDEFGVEGYAVPNWSNDRASLNKNIKQLVWVIGRNLQNIMHHEDARLAVPPSVNTLIRIHKLYQRIAGILASRSIPAGTLNMETAHATPSAEFFTLFPTPFFKVRSPFMRDWAGFMLIMLTECMQHTENARSLEISEDFAAHVGQFPKRLYEQMAIEMFGKSVEDVTVPGFALTADDFAAYNPTEFFTSTELTDTVAGFHNIFTEDRLRTITEGILTIDMPANMGPYPTNAIVYNQQHAAAANPGGTNTDSGASSGASTGSGPIIPPINPGV